MTYFPKKSHHGYYDPILGRHFYDKKQKQAFMKEHKFVEGDSASKAHLKRVNDFVAYCKDKRRKDPTFRMKNEQYPD